MSYTIWLVSTNPQGGKTKRNTRRRATTIQIVTSMFLSKNAAALNTAFLEQYAWY